ncbi:FG-GAP repeat protein [Halosimplex pelagicum]|uniref:FG-GAP repeat protein n=1 Tax=Halosimplex pelagicum TaxID=869886 RepID=UPI001FE3E67D|nr:FG-GAP repeat protein [Halosimplex pelagicum]
MTAHRRQFLRLCGIAGIGAIAGCSDGSGDDGTPDPTDAPSDTSEPPSETAETPPETADTPSETADTPPETAESTGGWTQRANFDPDDGDTGDMFGYSLAVSGDGTTAVVGAIASGDFEGTLSATETPSGGDTSTADESNGQSSGAAYVFDGSGGSWSQAAKLTPDDGDSQDYFGSSVAVSSDGTTAVIGAYGDEDPNGEEAGSAYVFEAVGDSWTQRAKLAPDDGEEFDGFGYSAAMSSDGTSAVVGCYQTDPDTRDAGSAYVFDRSGESWTQQAKLTADDGESEDDFAKSLALSDNGATALVGDPHEADPNGDLSGSAYVFDGSGESWTRRAKLTAADGDSDDVFGWSVALSGDGTTALVGAFGDEDPYGDLSGSAYVFDGSGEAWTQQAKLIAEDGDAKDHFGISVALSGDGSRALLGAENKYSSKTTNAGAAYVFDGSDDSWAQQAKLVDDAANGQQFGNSVALSTDGATALVGDVRDFDTDGSGGSAYVFTS